MRIIVRSMLLAGGLALAAGVTPASAQVFEQLTFKTTFAFKVGQKTLPAGSYTVRPALDGDGSLLEIEGRNGSALFFGENAGEPRSNRNEDSVTFNRSGDQYVLAEIWDGAVQEGADMVPPREQHADKGEGHRAKK